MSRESVIGDGQSPVRRTPWRVLFVLAFFLLLVCAFSVLRLPIRFWVQPPHVRIVGELPTSARLVRHQLVRHGLDYCHLFEFACSDTRLRDGLVRKWRLRDLSGSNEDPYSFVVHDSPSWWPSDLTSVSAKFGRVDETTEEYWSVWEETETGRVYVEVGRW